MFNFCLYYKKHKFYWGKTKWGSILPPSPLFFKGNISLMYINNKFLKFV